MSIKAKTKVFRRNRLDYAIYAAKRHPIVDLISEQIVEQVNKPNKEIHIPLILEGNKPNGNGRNYNLTHLQVEAMSTHGVLGNGTTDAGNRDD